MTGLVITLALLIALIVALLWRDTTEQRTATRIPSPEVVDVERDRLDALRGIERRTYLYALSPDYAGYEHVRVDVVVDRGSAHASVRTMAGSYLWSVRGTEDPAAVLAARGYVTVTPR